MEGCGAESMDRSVEDQKLSRRTLKSLNEMREAGQLTDAILEAEGVRFPVHRIILASSSAFFRALFTGGFRESTTSSGIQLHIPAATLRDIIHFAYNRNVHLSCDNVADLFHWADYLHMTKLYEKCARFMENELNVGNCLQVWQLAQKHEGLKKTTWKFFVQNFEKIAAKNTELMELPSEDFVRLLNEDALNCTSENVVFETGRKWLSQNAQKRDRDAANVLKATRMACMDRTVLEKLVEEGLPRNHPEIKDFLVSSLKVAHGLHLDNREILMLTETRAWRPRLPSRVLLAVGGWSGASPTNVVESYNVRTKKWTVLPFNDPAGPRAYHGLALLHGNMYMAGGFNGTQYFSSVREFDPRNSTWKERGPMASKRCYVSLASVDGKLMALGGFDGHVRTNSAECYDPGLNQWTSLTPMIAQRSDAHCAVIDDKIYICGGFNGQDCLESVEVFDIRGNRWQQVRRMTSKRSGVGVVAMNGVLYALGGFNGLQRMNSVERYDPRRDMWDSLSPMELKRSNFGMETCEGKVFVCGGFNGATTIADSELFDPRLNCWLSCPPMNVNRSALYVCALDNLDNAQDFLGPCDFPFTAPTF